MLPPDEFLFFSTGAVQPPAGRHRLFFFQGILEPLHWKISSQISAAQILDHSTLRGRIRKFNIRIP
jgi:hypothetical protein